MANKKREFKGVWIPNYIWLAKNISNDEKILLAEIDSWASLEGSEVSNASLSNFLNVSIPSITRYISDLMEKGYLDIDYSKGKRLIKMITPPNQNDETPNQNDETPNQNDEGYNNINSNINSNININNTNNNINNLTNNELLKKEKETNKEKQRKVEAFFNTFWGLYPRKSGKGYAKQSFYRVFAKISLNEIDGVGQQIIEALSKQKETTFNGREMQYIPHPSTWLNQQRWLDNPERNGKIKREPDWLQNYANQKKVESLNDNEMVDINLNEIFKGKE